METEQPKANTSEGNALGLPRKLFTRLRTWSVMERKMEEENMYCPWQALPTERDSHDGANAHQLQGQLACTLLRLRR